MVGCPDGTEIVAPAAPSEKEMEMAKRKAGMGLLMGPSIKPRTFERTVFKE
jgi:hypothetical protein